MIDSDSEEYESDEKDKVDKEKDSSEEEDLSEEESTESFNYEEEELQSKKVKDLKELVIKMTQRKGGTYEFPLGKRGYRTKGQIIQLIKTCQGKSNSKDKYFDYLDEDTLYSLKLKELKSHVEDMITRDEGSYKFALSGFKKDDLVNLILACQGNSVQKGSGRGGGNRFKGHGWGFSF